MKTQLIRHAIREILLEVTDEDLGAKSEWRDKTPEERRAIWSQRLTDQQKSDIAHHILDVIGLMPGPGDVADVINAAIYAREKQYFLAALSVICLIPAIGTAVGIAKKAGKALPAKIIFEHADEIERIISQIAPELPNGEKVAEAVAKIISDVKMGAEGIDLATGVATKSASKEATQVGSSAAARWYSNPKWKEWAISIIKPNLTKVLNEASSKRARNRLIKTLTRDSNYKMKIQLKGIKEGPFGHLFKGIKEVEAFYEGVLEQNTQIAKFVSSNFSLILEDLKQNLRFRIVVDPEEVAKFTNNPLSLAMADPYDKEVVIFLPRFGEFASDPAVITAKLINTVKHETWHIIDSRLAAIFKQKMEGEFLSELDEMSSTMQKMADNFNVSNVSENLREYIVDPRELFVRVKEMRDFLKKSEFSAEDLMEFADSSYESVPMDISFFHVMMQGISDDAFKNLADAMNEIL